MPQQLHPFLMVAQQIPEHPLAASVLKAAADGRGYQSFLYGGDLDLLHKAGRDCLRWATIELVSKHPSQKKIDAYKEAGAFLANLPPLTEKQEAYYRDKEAQGKKLKTKALAQMAAAFAATASGGSFPCPDCGAPHSRTRHG